MFEAEKPDVNGLLKQWDDIDKMITIGSTKALEQNEMVNIININKFILLLKHFPSGHTRHSNTVKALIVISEVHQSQQIIIIKFIK